MLLLLSSDHFALTLLDICIGSWMLRGWLAGLLQPYIGIVLILVLRLVSVAVLWLLCLPLALLLSCLLLAVFFCLLLAMLFCLLLALLFSVLFILSPLLDVERCERIVASMFFTLSSCPCCFTSFFSPLARWPWFCVGFSPLAPWLWFSVSDPLQRHFVVAYILLDASPAPPTPLLSIAPFVIVGSR